VTQRQALSAGLQGELERVAATLAIQTMKATYAQHADAKYTPDYRQQPPEIMERAAWQQALCFTEDAAWSGGDEFGGRIEGREQLFQWFKKSPWRWCQHFYVCPILAIGDGTASGRWKLWQAAIPRDGDSTVFLAATTREEYRLVEGQWLHSAMRFEELHLMRAGAGAGLPTNPMR
jgi:hypothetical protein